MLGENLTFGGGAEILNRPTYEAVSMTIDFSGATGSSDGFKKADTGELFLPAGMPVDKDGKPKKDTPFTDAVGILLCDVYAHRPQGTILTKAYVNVEAAQKNADVTYDGKLVAELNGLGNRIRFEKNDGTVIKSDSAGE